MGTREPTEGTPKGKLKMKKLMIASAIAVAAFALKADITSANVVG